MAEKSHKWVYVVIIVVIAAAMVGGAVLHHDQKVTKEAQQKAKVFVAKLHDAGLPAPTEAEAVRLYGVDGGPFAGSPDADLEQAEYGWWHGTAGAANRPFILDADYVEAARIFVEVYVPDKLAAFDEYVNGLKTDDSQ
jgi:hypothetical protein